MSIELDEAAEKYYPSNQGNNYQNSFLRSAFKLGAKWQLENIDVDKYELFKFFSEEHNMILTDTELNDIIHAVTQQLNQLKQ